MRFKAALLSLLLLLPALANHTDLSDEADKRREGENTGIPPPEGSAGIILDSFLGEPNPLSTTLESRRGAPGTPTYALFSLLADRVNPRRSSAGALPEIVHPGSTFYAWYGLWEDQNENLRIDALGGKETEFVPVSTQIYSFVEPGSHPATFEYHRPGPSEPDVTYTFGSPYFVSGGYPSFHDGSLLRRIDVATIANGTLTPTEFLPYTCFVPSCRIDLDTYSSIVGDPIEGIWGATAALLLDDYVPTLGYSTLILPPGVVRTVNSTGGILQEAEREVDEVYNSTVAPALEEVFRILDPLVGPPVRDLYSQANRTLSNSSSRVEGIVNSLPVRPLNWTQNRREDELDVANGSSAGEWGREGYASGWHAYLDALLVYGIGAYLFTWVDAFTDTTGRGPSGWPGWAGIFARLGIAHDANGDGSIDIRTLSEFRGICLPGTDRPPTDRRNLFYTLVPDRTWGDAPILEWRFSPDQNGGSGFTGKFYTGNTPIRGYSYCDKPNENRGNHIPGFYYLAPLGLPPFTLFMGSKEEPVAVVNYTQEGISLSEPIWDVDRYVGFLPQV